LGVVDLRRRSVFILGAKGYGWGMGGLLGDKKRREKGRQGVGVRRKRKKKRSKEGEKS
jgi:hypothetical protein